MSCLEICRRVRFVSVHMLAGSVGSHRDGSAGSAGSAGSRFSRFSWFSRFAVQPVQLIRPVRGSAGSGLVAVPACTGLAFPGLSCSGLVSMGWEHMSFKLARRFGRFIRFTVRPGSRFSRFTVSAGMRFRRFSQIGIFPVHPFHGFAVQLGLRFRT